MEAHMQDSAPVTQLMVTVQFQPFLSGLNVVHLAEIRSLFADSHPIVNSIGRAGPMAARLGEPPFGAAGMLPRLQLLKADLSGSILVQDDRISLSWDRTTSLADPDLYPGFEAIFAEFTDASTKIVSYLASAGMAQVSPRVGEIIYTDRIQTGSPEGDAKPLSSLFAFLNPSCDIWPESYNFTWQYPFSIMEIEGYIMCILQGPEILPDSQRAANLQSIGSFDLAGCTWRDMERRFLAVRSTIGELYQKLVIRTAEATLQS